jgi:hypothetical protein
MADVVRKVADLEQRVRRLESRLDELTRQLKRSVDDAVKKAARRAQ